MANEHVALEVAIMLHMAARIEGIDDEASILDALSGEWTEAPIRLALDRMTDAGTLSRAEEEEALVLRPRARDELLALARKLRRSRG